jgi:hypothetical protein
MDCRRDKAASDWGRFVPRIAVAYPGPPFQALEFPMAIGFLPHVRVPAFIPGDRVRLGEDGRQIRASSDPARVGTVVKLARDGRHLWVRWDGTGRPQLFFEGYLERVSLWRYA